MKTNMNTALMVTFDARVEQNVDGRVTLRFEGLVPMRLSLSMSDLEMVNVATDETRALNAAERDALEEALAVFEDAMVLQALKHYIVHGDR
jgi:hypothetical protein